MSDRARLREDVDRAYELQARAATRGAAQSTAIGVGLATLGHYYWPLFRRQTLAFKGFLVSAVTMFGLVVSAEHALLSHEAERRLEENAIRNEARLDLAKRGLIGTEREIAKWKAERARMQISSHSPSR